MKHIINTEVLKACDIRGVYNKNLFSKDFYYIGKAFGTILKKNKLNTCSVGRDGRSSSKELCDNLIKGLLETGVDVINLNLVSSPALYFSHRHLNTGGSCMVTASHNLSKYNGCKFVLKDTVFGEKQIKEIDKICKEGSFIESNEKASLKDYDIKEPYINHLLSILSNDNLENAKIVWDGSNGATLFVLKDFLKRIKGEHIVICDTIDPNFSNHEPDPSKEINTALLKKAVLDNNADLGIIFDGDGDRLACVTNNNRYVKGDELLLILAKDYILTHKDKKVMSEVKASNIFYSQIKKLGGNPIMWKVGHTFQQEKMIQDSIGFGGETSGHIFYLENNYEDDGLYAALKLLNILYKDKKCNLNDHIKQIPDIFTEGEVRLTLDTENISGICFI